MIAVAPVAAEGMGLDQYLTNYASELGSQAERSLRPLHVPAVDKVHPLIAKLKRKLFDAQAHVVTAAAEMWKTEPNAVLCGEMGTGKSAISVAAAHTCSDGKPYVGMVSCPLHLVDKWCREIKETLGEDEARVSVISNWKDMLALRGLKLGRKPHWYVIAHSTSKLGYKWKPAVMRRKHMPEELRCVHCGTVACGENGKEYTEEDLARSKRKCRTCKEPLWGATNDLRKVAPAYIAKKFLTGKIDYLILDEAHEAKGGDTAIGSAMHCLVHAAKHFMCATGTLTGGSADHLRPILWRLFPKQMRDDGLVFNEPLAFAQRYGRIETTIRESGGEGRSNRMSAGKTNKSLKCVPGIMPSLFGKHLIRNTLFLSLAQVAEGLPNYEEHLIGVEMDAHIRKAYTEVETVLRAEVQAMLRTGNKRLLGRMLHTLLCYPDHPFDWKEIKVCDPKTGVWRHVVTPPSLDDTHISVKEQKLVELCKAQLERGRKTWVYVQYVNEHDVASRVAGILRKNGLRVGVLKSDDVEPAKREAWIAKNGPNFDVIVSNPKLVETGVDFFDKAGRYNFPAIVFFETSYQPYTLRQAARRAWRLAQWDDCETFYIYHKNAMQEKAVSLMARKIQAAEALEGKWSSDGLASIDEGGGLEMALAKALVENISEPAGLVWKKIKMSHVSTMQKSAKQQPVLPTEVTQASVIPPAEPARCSEPRAASVRVKARPITCSGLTLTVTSIVLEF